VRKPRNLFVSKMNIVVVVACTATVLNISGVGASTRNSIAPHGRIAVPSVGVAPRLGTCPDVLVMGARGSGQKITDEGGMGPDVESMYRIISGILTAKGLIVKPWVDPFPAASATLLLPSATEVLAGPLADALYAKNVSRFTGSIVVGVNDAISELSTEEAVCPKTSIILAGYSQGAMVMHDLGEELIKSGRQGLLTPVRATLLLGDGDRTGSTKARQFGIENGAGVGVRTWLRLKIPGLDSGGSVADVIQPARTAEICNWGDLVCDFKLSDLDGVSAYHGYKIHIGYVTKTLVPDQPVAAASAWAASLVPIATSGTGGIGAWSSAAVDGSQIDKIVCTSLTFCIADDDQGNVLTTNDPTGGASAWAFENIASDQLNASIACPSSTECVIGDANGTMWYTNDVTDGSSAVWSTNYSDPSGGLAGISCPSVNLCVASDLSGNIMWTTDPGGSWSSSDVDGGNSIWDVDCPSVTLCLAVDLDGNVLTSSNPESGNWTISDVDGANELYSISCVSVHFCAAIDASGNVITTVNPGLASAWRSDFIDPEATAGGGAQISCPSVNLCVAGDDAGQVESSGNPLGGHLTWIATSLTSNSMFAMSCPTTTECIGGDNAGNIYWEQGP